MSAYFAHCSRHFRRIFPQNDELDSELLIASPIEWLSEIGVVTVLVITVAAETRFDSLDTAGLGAADYPVGGGRPAFFSVHEGNFPFLRSTGGQPSYGLRNIQVPAFRCLLLAESRRPDGQLLDVVVTG